MRSKLSLILLLILVLQDAWGQRKVSPGSSHRKSVEREEKREGRKKDRSATELRWNPRQIPSKSKGYPDISAWHAGTAGIVASDGAELNLFQVSRIGFSKHTELLFRVAEEPFLPNVGVKHLWAESKRFFLGTEHTLYYTYPGLKILQKSGFKDLIADSVRINHGIAMRHEILLSWLMNPRIWGCPDPPPEKILTLRVGTEFYVGFGDTEIRPFDYAHTLYHTQLLDRKVLYYGGLQFDSYFNNRFHYSLNGLFYSVDMKKEYAVEVNLRFTCYITRRVGLSLAAKGAYLNIGEKTKFACLPLVDITYLINPGRGTIKHGLTKRRHKRF